MMANDRESEEQICRYNTGRKISNIAVLVGMAGLALAGKDYFATGDGSAVPVAGLVTMGAMYSSYYCERMSTWIRTGVDPWRGNHGDRAQAYKNFFSGEHKDLSEEDQDLE